jgi:hypothetical protein
MRSLHRLVLPILVVAGVLAVPAVLLVGCGKALDSSQTPGTGGEICFNGVDDEGDDRADCADPKCGETAACIPVSDAAEAGALVEIDQPCPDGFDGGEVVIHQGLDQGACAGCDCAPGDTLCSAAVWYYPDDASCAADTGATAGVEAPVPAAFACPEGGVPISTGYVFGARVDVEASSTCSPSGTAALGPTGWARSMKFCRASLVGTGCAEGQACVPRQEPDVQCALTEGDADCTGYESAEPDWYTGVDADGRACGECSCTAVGGNCDAVVVQVGTDYSCNTTTAEIADGTQVCFGQVYAPPVNLAGVPVAPTDCTAEAPLTGEATPSGQETLCCAPAGG